MKTLDEYLTANELNDARAAPLFGCKRSYFYQVRHGRKPSDRVALNIWTRTGIKLGRLEGLTDAEIRAFARVVLAA